MLHGGGRADRCRPAHRRHRQALRNGPVHAWPYRVRQCLSGGVKPTSGLEPLTPSLRVIGTNAGEQGERQLGRRVRPTCGQPVRLAALGTTLAAAVRAARHDRKRRWHVPRGGITPAGSLLDRAESVMGPIRGRAPDPAGACRSGRVAGASTESPPAECSRRCRGPRPPGARGCDCASAGRGCRLHTGSSRVADSSVVRIGATRAGIDS